MEENFKIEVCPQPAKTNYFRKLLPYIFIAEVGLIAFQIGFCFITVSGVETMFFAVCALASVAAFVFTILYALNIKPKFDIAAIMVCISLTIFLYLLMVAISSFLLVKSYKADIQIEQNEFMKNVLTQMVNSHIVYGSTSIFFAVSILPLSVYLPIWYLKRH